MTAKTVAPLELSFDIETVQNKKALKSDQI